MNAPSKSSFEWEDIVLGGSEDQRWMTDVARDYVSRVLTFWTSSCWPLLAIADYCLVCSTEWEDYEDSRLRLIVRWDGYVGLIIEGCIIWVLMIVAEHGFRLKTLGHFITRKWCSVRRYAASSADLLTGAIRSQEHSAWSHIMRLACQSVEGLYSLNFVCKFGDQLCTWCINSKQFTILLFYRIKF